jgi:hypothetical protein
LVQGNPGWKKGLAQRFGAGFVRGFARLDWAVTGFVATESVGKWYRPDFGLGWESVQKNRGSGGRFGEGFVKGFA